jgi:hypothetical protein
VPASRPPGRGAVRSAAGGGDGPRWPLAVVAFAALASIGFGARRLARRRPPAPQPVGDPPHRAAAAED